MQAREDQIDAHLGRQGLPDADSDVPVRMDEVIAEDEQEWPATESIGNLRDVGTRCLRSVGTGHVIQAQWQCQHPLRRQPGDLFFEPIRDVSADRGDAVDRQGDAPLQGPVRLPRREAPVIARDVVGDQIEIGRDHPSSD